ncbi:uncharacterized protein B0H64DRAFT_211003 [Chaetomium fimeti]|uniref:Uncharacterized protein n=1 Tax=Chaetomium fimeti TaxID=1854472 RepID=A0AAE0LQB0_9PEZI|nr:hypothetical protein B0H64DRAFT_211003 [Chaetomium fimeti]
MDPARVAGSQSFLLNEAVPGVKHFPTCCERPNTLRIGNGSDPARSFGYCSGLRNERIKSELAGVVSALGAFVAAWSVFPSNSAPGAGSWLCLRALALHVSSLHHSRYAGDVYMWRAKMRGVQMAKPKQVNRCLFSLLSLCVGRIMQEVGILPEVQVSRLCVCLGRIELLPWGPFSREISRFPRGLYDGNVGCVVRLVVIRRASHPSVDVGCCAGRRRG